MTDRPTAEPRVWGDVICREERTHAVKRPSLSYSSWYLSSVLQVAGFQSIEFAAKESEIPESYVRIAIRWVLAGKPPLTDPIPPEPPAAEGQTEPPTENCPCWVRSTGGSEFAVAWKASRKGQGGYGVAVTCTEWFPNEIARYWPYPKPFPDLPSVNPEPSKPNAALENAYRSAILERELAKVLADRQLVVGASAQLIRLWRDDLDVYEDNETFKVRARDGRSVAQAVTDWLLAEEYSHFCLAPAVSPEPSEPVADEDAEILRERLDACEDLLAKIGDLAHEKSTGPAVFDGYWEIRELAYHGDRGPTKPESIPPAQPESLPDQLAHLTAAVEEDASK